MSKKQDLNLQYSSVSEYCNESQNDSNSSVSSSDVSKIQQDSQADFASKSDSELEEINQDEENSESNKWSSKRHSCEIVPHIEPDGFFHLYDDLLATGFFEHPWIKQHFKLSKRTIRETLFAPDWDFKLFLREWCLQKELYFDFDTLKYSYEDVRGRFIVEHDVKKIKYDMILNLKSLLKQQQVKKKDFYQKLKASLHKSPQQAKEYLLRWLQELNFKIYIHANFLFPSIEPQRYSINGQIPIHFLESENILFMLKIDTYDLRRLEKFYQKKPLERAMNVVQENWKAYIIKNLKSLRLTSLRSLISGSDCKAQKKIKTNNYDQVQDENYDYYKDYDQKSSRFIREHMWLEHKYEQEQLEYQYQQQLEYQYE